MGTDCGGQRTRYRSRSQLSGSTVGSSDPVQVNSFTSAVTHGTTTLLVQFLKFVYGRGHVYHDACTEDKGWFVIVCFLFTMWAPGG